MAADKGLRDLSADFKDALRKPRAKLTVLVEVGKIAEEIHAEGSPHLTLTHSTEMVLRKSDFSSDRTLGIYADKAAKNLSRDLVEKLKNREQCAKITLIVQV